MLDGSPQAQAATVAPESGDAIRLLGLDFANRPLPEIAAGLSTRPADSPFTYVVTANSHQLVRLSREADLRPHYEGAWLRLLGSRVVFKLCRMLGLPAPAVIPGCDLSAHLIAHEIDRDEPVTLLGLVPDGLAKLKARTGLRRVDHHNPPAGFENDPAAFEKAMRFIETHPARFTFLAMDAQQQCILADALRQRGRATGTGLCIGEGLLPLTGLERRAPRAVQQMGLEWAWRLAQDPRGLAQRYLVESPGIVALLRQEAQDRGLI
jgi:UDP-N-acetyl-D-mannosaminuronic acid transferase (WecB/TagA/CpsF family)